MTLYIDRVVNVRWPRPFSVQFKCFKILRRVLQKKNLFVHSYVWLQIELYSSESDFRSFYLRLSAGCLLSTNFSCHEMYLLRTVLGVPLVRNFNHLSEMSVFFQTFLQKYKIFPKSKKNACGAYHLSSLPLFVHFLQTTAIL